MSDMIITDRALKDALDAFSGNYFDIVAHLYTNNLTLTRAVDWSDFTIASYPGYVGYLWSTGPATIVEPNVGGWSTAAVSWAAPTSGSPVNIYGFLIRYQRAGGDHVMLAARFGDAPRAFAVGDPPMTLNAMFTDQDFTL
jgi:hypothetical protein